VGVAAGTFVRPGSTFAAEIHAQIAGIDSDDAKNGIWGCHMDPLIGSIGASVGSSGSAEAKQIAIMSYRNSAAKYFGGHAGAAGTIISTVTTNCLPGDLSNICWNVERFTS
jgi:hypothetical protein